MSAEGAALPRLALTVLPLAIALAACGGSDSRAQSPAPATEPERRAGVVVYAPVSGKVVPARPFGQRRLRAVIRMSGRAAPGQQLSVRAACGRYSCDGITFAGADGRWRTRVQLVTPPRRRAVRVRVAYADATAGERSATIRVRLRRARATPAPTPAAGSPSTGGATAPSGSSEPYAGPRTMIVIGDSLAVGMAEPLRALLGDWPLSTDGRTGRPLAEGMEILAETALPPGAEGRRAILAFSLFTNDDPTNVDALETAVRQSVARLGPRGCAIWATIARPPLNGVGYRAANERLEALAQDPQLYGRLLIVPWQREYARRPSWRRPDGVHATPQGYAGRAQLYADAARACPR